MDLKKVLGALTDVLNKLAAFVSAYSDDAANALWALADGLGALDKYVDAE